MPLVSKPKYEAPPLSANLILQILLNLLITQQSTENLITIIDSTKNQRNLLIQKTNFPS